MHAAYVVSFGKDWHKRPVEDGSVSPSSPMPMKVFEAGTAQDLAAKVLRDLDVDHKRQCVVLVDLDTGWLAGSVSFGAGYAVVNLLDGPPEGSVRVYRLGDVSPVGGRAAHAV